MTMFDKKDKDDANDAFEGVGEIENPGGLAARGGGRISGPGEGSRKGLLMLGLLVTVFAVAGGYYYMSTTVQHYEPPMVAAVDPSTILAEPTMAAAPEASISEAPDATAATADPLAVLPPPADAGAMPPQPDAAAALPADPAAAGAATIDPVAEALGTPPADAGVPPEDALLTPDIMPGEAAPEEAGPAPGEVAVPAGPLPVPGEAALAQESPPAPGTKTETVITTVPPSEMADAPVDLPVPESMTAAPSPDKSAEGPAVVAVPEPTPAEKAIVENAAVLDQLSQPAPGDALPTAAETMKTADEILGQDAVIRPLPKEYLIVKKDHAAGDIDSRLTASRLALAQNRNTAALQLFNELRDEYPKDKRVLMGRAVSLQRLGQSEEALAAYEDVLNSDPKNLEALTNMLGLLKKENPGLAVEKLLELREAYPYNADITAQLGIAYAGVKEYDEAMKYLDMAEALKPGSAEVLYNKAVLYDRMGKSQEAGALYRQIIRLSAEGRIDTVLPIEAVKRRLATLR